MLERLTADLLDGLPSSLRDAFDVATGMVDRASRIVTIAHPRMDGDAAGTCFGLVQIFRELGKQAHVVSQGAFMEELHFLPGADEYIQWEGGGWDRDWRPDLIVTCDLGSADRVDGFLKLFPGVPVINLDHHASNEGFGDAALIDLDAAASGVVAYLWARRAGWPISIEAATQFFTALLTDTGCFTYSNTTPPMLAIAAALTGHGVKVSEIARGLYRSRKLEVLKLEALAISRIQTAAGGNLAWSSLTQSDFTSLGLTLLDAHDIVNIVKSVRGVVVAVLFTELPGGKVKISFRGEGYHDLNAFANAIGGGGHPRASGATVPGELATVMTDVISKLEPQANTLGEQRW